MKKILITGGLGNLGYWLTKHFLKAGFDVYVLSRKKDKPDDGLCYSLISVNIEDYEELKKKLDFSFEYCIHLAGSHDYMDKNYFISSVKSNVLGTRNLIEVLKSKDSFCHFIYFSTFHIYGTDSGFINEQTIPVPKNDYSITHLFCEQYLAQFYLTNKFPSTIVRLTNGYGHPMGGSFTKWYLLINGFVKSAYYDKSIVLLSDGLASRDFIWHGDVARITEQLIAIAPNCETFNIASGFVYKIIDIAEIVCDIHEERYGIRPVVSKKESSGNLSVDLIIDTSKIKSFIDFSCTDMLKEEINMLFNCLEQEDMLNG